jgi:hypothetical protein
MLCAAAAGELALSTTDAAVGDIVPDVTLCGGLGWELSFLGNAESGVAADGALDIVDCIALRGGCAGVRLNAGHRHRTGGRGSDVDSGVGAVGINRDVSVFGATGSTDSFLAETESVVAT